MDKNAPPSAQNRITSNSINRKRHLDDQSTSAAVDIVQSNKRHANDRDNKVSDDQHDNNGATDTRGDNVTNAQNASAMLASLPISSLVEKTDDKKSELSSPCLASPRRRVQSCAMDANMCELSWLRDPAWDHLDDGYLVFGFVPPSHMPPLRDQKASLDATEHFLISNGLRELTPLLVRQGLLFFVIVIVVVVVVISSVC